MTVPAAKTGFYDNPEIMVYEFGATPEVALQFGAAGETVAYPFLGPKGKRGKVVDMEVAVTETMVGTTTVPEIGVGVAAGTAGTPSYTYARYRVGTAAGTGLTAAATAPFRVRSLCTGNPTPPVSGLFTGHVALETDFLPADTVFYINFNEGVDGTEAGAARVKVMIHWF
jgi:hypothetical protein